MSIYSTPEDETFSNDSFHESLEHEYNQFYDYASDAGSYKNAKQGAKTAKYEDPGFNSVPCSMKGKAQHQQIDFYETSASPNRFIRDAITGVRRVPYRTGTADEDLFFSVRVATGEGRYADGSNLFYDSPEQFERHFRLTVSPAIKEAWQTKTMIARQKQLSTTTSKHATIVK